MKLVPLLRLTFSAGYTFYSEDDYVGNDIAFFYSTTSSLCTAKCDLNNKCVAVQYHTDSDECYLKSKYPKEAYLPNHCDHCSIYQKQGTSSPFSNAFMDNGWFIDENISVTSDDMTFNKAPFDWGTSVNATCEQKNCFAKQRWNFPSLYSGYDSKYVVYTRGYFFATRTAVSNHFTLVVASSYSGFSGPFLTPKYTMAACMSECFHNPQCQYAYYTRVLTKCALLSYIDTSKLVTDLTNYLGDIQIVAKTWQYNSTYSALPNYILTSIGISFPSGNTVSKCLKYCTDNNIPVCTFDYTLNTCRYFLFFDLSKLSNTTSNVMTFIQNSASNAEIVPFFAREGSPILTFSKMTTSVGLSTCQTDPFCNFIVQDGLSNILKLYYANFEDESTAIMGMGPLILTIKVKGTSYISQVPGYIVQPKISVSASSSISVPNFDFEKCWGTASCLYYTNFKQFSNLIGATILPASSIFVSKTTVGNQFIELSNVTSTLGANVVILGRTLAQCLNNCLYSTCTYVFYDLSNFKCSFYDVSQIVYSSSLTNQYSQNIVTYKRMSYLGYSGFSDVVPTLNLSTLIWLNKTEGFCISSCEVQAYCYGVIYCSFYKQCSLVLNIKPINTQPDARYIWYRKLKILTTEVEVRTTIHSSANTGIRAAFTPSIEGNTAVSDIFYSSESIASNTESTTESNMTFVEDTYLYTSMFTGLPSAKGPTVEPFTGNFYLIIGLFIGLLALMFITFLLSKYFKSPKYKSKFDTRTRSTISNFGVLSTDSQERLVVGVKKKTTRRNF